MFTSYPQSAFWMQKILRKIIEIEQVWFGGRHVDIHNWIIVNVSLCASIINRFYNDENYKNCNLFTKYETNGFLKIPSRLSTGIRFSLLSSTAYVQKECSFFIGQFRQIALDSILGNVIFVTGE